MSKTHEEMQIDLDALDDKKVANGKDHVEEPAAAVAAPAVAQGEDGLDKLKKQLETEKAGRIAAERRAQDATDSEARARGEVHGTQLDLLTNAIASLTQAGDVLESKYAEAMAASDWAGSAKIQREMSTTSAKLLALENGKKQLENQKPVARQRTNPDVVEDFASRLQPPSAAWVRAHPEFVTDPQKNRQMLAAHELALARGYKGDTDDYFASIEKTLDLRKAEPIVEDPNPDEEVDPMKDAAKPITPARKAAPAAAPVTRSGNGTGARPNTVTLTPQEVEVAEMNGITPEQYAKNKQALKKEGRLN